MERNTEILRRDARAPLCLKPVPRWRYEHAFRQTLRPFLGSEAELEARAVEFLTAHHAQAQEFVNAVDQVIVAERPSIALVRGALVSLHGTSSALAELTGHEGDIERVREILAERFPTEGGRLPEFCWEKGADELFRTKIRAAGIKGMDRLDDLSVRVGAVYDDCARALQLGIWVMAAPWRAEVVDTWLFESAYTFFHHTISSHLRGPAGLIAAIPAVVSALPRT